MKKFFFFFFFIILFIFTSSVSAFDFFGLFGQSNQVDNGLPSMMTQGKNRSCLTRTAGGNQAHPASGKMIMYATLNLNGSCLSQTGCEIWVYNTGNDNIEVNEDILKKCKNGWTGNACNDTQKIEDEIAREVNVKPGWHQITDFTVLSSRPGKTNIAINTDNLDKNKETVLGTESGMVPQGEVNIAVSGKFAGHVAYSYYAIGDANTMGTGGEGEGTDETSEGHDATQQLGTYQQGVPTPTLIPGYQEQKCVTLYWDPFGRVFDASSLEPMSDVKVTLLDDKGSPAVIDGPFKNWDITKVDNGIYNILVDKEGDYQLTVDAPKTHLFTREVNLHQNFSLVYSDIYYSGDIFHEAPMPEIIPPDFDYSKYHHDIPLKPIGKPYYVDPSDVYVLKSSLKQTDMGNFINYAGKVTFPKAKVCLVGELSRKIVGNCVNAEKYGNFTINVKKSDIPQEKLLLIAEKVDLTQPIIKNNQVNLTLINAENNRSFEPILNYIEGYAYDKDGKALPKAKVTVVLKDGDVPLYTTTTDDSGFFIIYGKNLPFAEYYLTFTPADSQESISQTTSKFITSNKSYLDSNNLNLITSTKNDQSIINPYTGKLNEIKDKPAVTPGPKTNKSNTVNKFAIVIIILFLLVVSVFGVVLYLKKYNNIH